MEHTQRGRRRTWMIFVASTCPHVAAGKTSSSISMSRITRHAAGWSSPGPCDLSLPGRRRRRATCFVAAGDAGQKGKGERRWVQQYDRRLRSPPPLLCCVTKTFSRVWQLVRRWGVVWRGCRLNHGRDWWGGARTERRTCRVGMSTTVDDVGKNVR
jgi:hypothetical protein